MHRVWTLFKHCEMPWVSIGIAYSLIRVSILFKPESKSLQTLLIPYAFHCVWIGFKPYAFHSVWIRFKPYASHSVWTGFKPYASYSNQPLEVRNVLQAQFRPAAKLVEAIISNSHNRKVEKENTQTTNKLRSSLTYCFNNMTFTNTSCASQNSRI